MAGEATAVPTDPESIDQLVLKVLHVQSPGYLAAPASTAFAAVGLDEATVQESLARLDAAGHALEYEDVQPVLDGDGNPVEDAEGNPLEHVIDCGWMLTDLGATAAEGVPPLDELAMPQSLAQVPPPPPGIEDLLTAVVAAGDFDAMKASIAEWLQEQS